MSTALRKYIMPILKSSHINVLSFVVCILTILYTNEWLLIENNVELKVVKQEKEKRIHHLCCYTKSSI